MEIYCTRPGCSRPRNIFTDLDDGKTLQTTQQKYCTACGMPLILAGRYLPVRLLGEGGFGRAFLARDRYTRRIRSCVVKQFQPSGNLSLQAMEVAQSLFEREAEVLEDLGHKNPQIPDLYAFFPLIVPNQLSGKEEQFFYLVQEYIDGETLEAELANRGAFAENEVRAILEDLLQVLQFIHDNGSIHRDIKPSNIMRDRNGSLYLLDFGAVKQVTASANSPQGHSTGIYSMGFAPPEQMQGSQVYPSTDLYALAATCLILLTNQQPDKLYDTYEHRWNWKSYAPKVSKQLVKILERMLQPKPADRFQSARDVLNALRGTSVITPPPKPSTGQITSLPPSPPTQSGKNTSFSLSEIFTNAAFIGFEGALLTIGLNSLLAAKGIIIACMILGGLIFAQFRRIIEGKDLLILAGISFLLLLIPNLQGSLSLINIAIIAVLAAAVAIAVTALFRLIYQFISRLF